MRIRAVTLDAAGTLIGVAEPVGATYARFAGAQGLAVEAGATERRFRDAFTAAPPLAFPGASPVRLADHERAWWYAIVRRALGAVPAGPALDATVDALFAYYAEARAWRVMPDAPAAMRALRGLGCRIAVVSNFDRRLGPLLDALGIAPLVDVVVCSTAVGSAKPQADIFRTAVTRLDGEAAATLHAGDDPVADVLGALGAGLRAALIDRAAAAPALPPGVPALATLAELPDLVARAV